MILLLLYIPFVAYCNYQHNHEQHHSQNHYPSHQGDYHHEEYPTGPPPPPEYQTAYFCDEQQQKEVGDLFHQYEKSIEIIDEVKRQLTTTEKDQLNMMENLNDTLAEQAFYVYKFHQLNPVELAVLTSAKASLTTALSSGDPDGALSKAMGSFSPQDLERFSRLKDRRAQRNEAAAAEDISPRKLR
uniref:DUF148 domain-containing protein n=1 Tax=Caenorhabditis tropicalis TaxID=1561998 RepID=A0A1I7UPE3_9PELO